MRFTLSDEQLQIKQTARELLGSRSPWETVRTCAADGRGDAGLWGELCSLGWPGIAVAAHHGGQGLGLVELAVLAEELGYACAPTPFLGTTLAALAIEAAGSDAQKAAWLERLAGGATGALGTTRGGDGALIPDGGDADVVVVVDDDAAVLVDSAAVETVQTVDPTRRYGRVAAVSGARLEGDVAGVLERAAVVVAAEVVGLCQRALDMTVAYVKDRKQFGVPVGTFQAVQHTAARMLLETEGGRSAVYYAAWAADAEPEALPMAAAIAKAWTSDAGRSVAGSAIQLHGGIGFTWEADVHWLYKRALLDAAYLGSGGTHRARVAALATAARSPTRGV